MLVKYFKFIAPTIFIAYQYSIAQVDLSPLPPATNYQESIEQRPLREKAFINAFLNIPLHIPPKSPKDGFQGFATTMLARMVNRVDLTSVSENILRPDFLPWLPGTDFALPGSLCKRVGDYDFLLQSLIKIAYIDRENGKSLLSDAARDKLYHVLLSQKGNEHHNQISVGGCITVTDTENHVLMTETARYLTNQILYNECNQSTDNCDIYDNSKNGFNDWMLKHLAEFLKNDFSEFNSKPYEGYTQIALGNIYTYSQNLNVKTMAQIVLDYMSAKFAIGSNGMRRLVPYRRQKWVLNHNILSTYDDTVFRQIVMAGNYNFLKFENSGQNPEIYNQDTYLPTMAALETYHIPDLILDIQMNKQTPYFQKIRHSDAEVFYSSPSFLLTAGGRWRNVPDFMTGENDAWAVATNIIPTKGEFQLKNLFYILGEQKVSERNNLCVSKNFSCGQNLHIPENMPENCTLRKGKWTFYNLKDCSLDYDFYVAVFKDKANSTWDDRNQNFGLFEVQEAKMDFTNFTNTVMQKNPIKNFRPNRLSSYETYDGQKIKFYFYALDLNHSPIVSINGQPQTTEISLWPRAEGDLLNAIAPSVFEIKNPHFKKKILLDASNPLRPVRKIIEIEP